MDTLLISMGSIIIIICPLSLERSMHLWSCEKLRVWRRSVCPRRPTLHAQRSQGLFQPAAVCSCSSTNTGRVWQSETFIRTTVRLKQLNQFHQVNDLRGSFLGHYPSALQHWLHHVGHMTWFPSDHWLFLSSRQSGTIEPWLRVFVTPLVCCLSISASVVINMTKLPVSQLSNYFWHSENARLCFLNMNKNFGLRSSAVTSRVINTVSLFRY